MSLFDQKEDVLEIQMTPYGKHLYSLGMFKPTYYSFHDDEIIYDITYAFSGSEQQNELFNRLTRDCVYLKTQSRYTSVEKTVKTIEVLNPLTDNYANGMPIGNSSVGNDYKPAWAINFLNGTISSFQEHYTQSNIPNVEIPQINLLDTTLITKLLGREEPPSSNDSFVSYFKDGTAIEMQNNYILLSVEEKNVDVLKDNFEIEIFEVDTDADGKELLKQIFFKKPLTNVVNNILLEDNEVKPEILDPNLPIVDNYFIIKFDKDIEFAETATQTVSAAQRILTRPPYGDNC